MPSLLPKLLRPLLLRRVIATCQQLLATSLPNRCLMCHQTVAAPYRGICACCLEISLYQTPTCLGCGRALLLQSCYCGACQHSQPLVVIAPASYHQGLGDLVAGIKYRAELAALDMLVLSLVERIKQLQRLGLIRLPQAMIAVPLHPNRLRQRGFNQAWLIADTLSRQLGIPLLDNVLVRRVDTRPQAGLTGKQRRRNLADAFVLTEPINYQRIALIDDVVTTGTTVQSIAELFAAHYIHLQVWCLARAEAPGLLE